MYLLKKGVRVTSFNGKPHIRLATFLRLNDAKFQYKRRYGAAGGGGAAAAAAAAGGCGGGGGDDIRHQRSGTGRRRSLVHHVLGPSLPAVSVLFILRKVQRTAGAPQKMHLFRLGVHFERSPIFHLFFFLTFLFKFQ